MPIQHAQAVLALCHKLSAEGHTVISANTDEHGTPQVFAQSEAGELAFYFLRLGHAEPTPEEHTRALDLAAQHGVSAYWCREAAAAEGPSDGAAHIVATRLCVPRAPDAAGARTHCFSSTVSSR